MRAGYHYRPEALLAGMDVALTELVILTPAVLVQKERPLQTPFLAPAHKLSSTRASSAGRTCPGLSVLHTPVSSPPTAPGWRAFPLAWSCAPWTRLSPIPHRSGRC